MAKIKIGNLSKNVKINAKEMGCVVGGFVGDAFLLAAERMQEMQISFNAEYLMLQNKISHENRQFSMVSNIRKSKHDTAQNAINNIR